MLTLIVCAVCATVVVAWACILALCRVASDADDAAARQYAAMREGLAVRPASVVGRMVPQERPGRCETHGVADCTALGCRIDGRRGA